MTIGNLQYALASVTTVRHRLSFLPCKVCLGEPGRIREHPNVPRVAYCQGCLLPWSPPVLTSVHRCTRVVRVALTGFVRFPSGRRPRDEHGAAWSPGFGRAVVLRHTALKCPTWASHG